MKTPDVSELMIIAALIDRDTHPLALTDIDRLIALALDIDLRPFTASFEAAYWLLDQVSADEGYVSVDYREYRDRGYVLCDINRDYGSRFEGSGDSRTRVLALVKAILWAMIRRIEVENDEGE